MPLSMLAPGINASAPGGALYGGDLPTVYASQTALGTGSGSTEGNATTYADALSDVLAGDCIGFLPGVLSAPRISTRWVPIFCPTASGTVSNPIRLRAKYSAIDNYANPALLTQLRISNPVATPPPTPTSPINSAVAGAGEGQSNLIIGGFYVNQANSPPRPSNGNFVASPGSSGIVFEDIVVDQVFFSSGDNYNAFYAEGSANPTYRRILVRGGQGGPLDNHNASAFTFYGCPGFLVERVTFDHVHNCIFPKGSNLGNYNSGTIRYCKSTGALVSFVEVGEVTVGSPVLIYQNLSIGDGQAVVFDNSGKGCSDTQVYSNTFVDSVNEAIRADSIGALTDMVIRDNIMALLSASSAYAVNYTTRSTSGTSPLDFNHYYRSSGAARFAQNNTTYPSLAQWRTATSKEASSTEGNPLFVNSTAGDYTLQASSPARSGSSTGGARGCYITGDEIIGAAA